MIHFVIGTRAQLFKMAPIMLECERRKLNWRWIYAAQHRETINATIKDFGLPKPDYTVLRWDTEASTLPKYFYWFFRIMLSLFRGRRILDGYTGKNHFLLTHGDTSTTVWGALLGKLYRCKVMHIEAGLRSFNLFNPFPEEINRLITSRLSDYYICPGQTSINNLKKYKGIKINTIFNTQADTIAYGLANADRANVKLPNKKYVVASIHRFENIFRKETIEHIVTLLEKIAKTFPILFVLHPPTLQQLKKHKLYERLQKNVRIELVPRQEYLPFIRLIKKSEFVITDGGGNQEELYFMGKPTLLFRKTTERPDELGKTAVLSNFDEETIDDFVKNYKQHVRKRVLVKRSPSKMIVDELVSFGQR